MYAALTGQVLPEAMPVRERRRLDVVVTYGDGRRQAVEFDESQHFTAARATTLGLYEGIPVCFDVAAWDRRCADRSGREPGGGFARPCPPLFPGEGGRHQQRAFRDFLADLLPPQRGWLPTMRVSDQEAQVTLRRGGPGFAALLESKMGGAGGWLRR